MSEFMLMSQCCAYKDALYACKNHGHVSESQALKITEYVEKSLYYEWGRCGVARDRDVVERGIKKATWNMYKREIRTGSLFGFLFFVIIKALIFELVSRIIQYNYASGQGNAVYRALGSRYK